MHLIVIIPLSRKRDKNSPNYIYITQTTLSTHQLFSGRTKI
ncbi:hypothetical protein DDD_2861 [Nonlabens dokdonensis DSW-6]|uniref:Uncharacterized protein n=1 Tax=Nonlabens dokdonensis (strain DSM 17205 / KCTC 12402 / DSW-6) TaxID=592029 RepID=L7WGD4_NONDD|nr:hypothetical protein DDD_2861 [Nonlabens dokdonensis DSW-6]